jgi:hypothetical protein
MVKILWRNVNFLPALQSGDSGAWVVDEDTNEAYGHVVASDVFGRGYVVPICDSFEDIKNRLSAELVSLPSKADVLTFNQHHYQLEPAFNGMYQPDLPPGQCFPTRGRQDFLEEFSPDDLPRFYNSSNYNSQVWGDRQSSIPYGSSPDIYLQYSPASHIQPSSLYKLPDSGYSTMNNSPGQSPQPTSGAGGIAIQPGPRFGDRRAVAFDRLDHNIDPNASQFPVSRTRQRSQSLTGKLVNPESDPTKGLRVQQFKATVETVGAAHKGAK